MRQMKRPTLRDLSCVMYLIFQQANISPPHDSGQRLQDKMLPIMSGTRRWRDIAIVAVIQCEMLLNRAEEASFEHFVNHLFTFMSGSSITCVGKIK